MTFPTQCFRGIRKEKWIDENGYISPLVYEPDERTKNDRCDGFIETSIEWDDEPGVLEYCFEHLKDVFIHGAVKISTENLEIVKKNPNSGRFAYERKKEGENDFHGNILFDSTLTNYQRRNIQGYLAFFSTPADSPNHK